jgi:hypothetical protein
MEDSKTIIGSIMSIKYSEGDKRVVIGDKKYPLDAIEILGTLNERIIHLNEAIQKEHAITTDLWKLCSHIYFNVLKKMAEAGKRGERSEPGKPEKKGNVTTTITITTRSFDLVKNRKGFRDHEFFKNFIMGPILKLNYHDSEKHAKNTKLTIDTIKKDFNGFDTCRCIFENQESFGAFQKKVAEYIDADGKLYKFIDADNDKNYILFGKDNNERDKVIREMVIELKLQQFLSLIDLCHINKQSEIERLVDKVIELEKELGPEQIKEVIPQELLNVLVQKLRSVNELHQLNYDNGNETLTEAIEENKEKAMKQYKPVDTSKTLLLPQSGVQNPQAARSLDVSKEKSREKETKEKETKEAESTQTKAEQQEQQGQTQGGGNRSQYKYIKYKARYLKQKNF